MLGFGGPDYDLEPLKRLIAWRDEYWQRNRRWLHASCGRLPKASRSIYYRVEHNDTVRKLDRHQGGIAVIIALVRTTVIEHYKPFIRCTPSTPTDTPTRPKQRRTIRNTL